MKYETIITTLVLSAGLILFSGSILAQADDINPIEATTFGELIDGVMTTIFHAAVVLGPTMIIVGGFMMLFAGADPSKIALGKKIILYTSVIFAIIVIIKALTYYFRGELTLQ